MNRFDLLLQYYTGLFCADEKGQCSCHLESQVVHWPVIASHTSSVVLERVSLGSQEVDELKQSKVDFRLYNHTTTLIHYRKL